MNCALSIQIMSSFLLNGIPYILHNCFFHEYALLDYQWIFASNIFDSFANKYTEKDCELVNC